MSPMKKSIFWAAVVLLPAAVLCDCTCEAEAEGDLSKSMALKYKVVAIAAILASSAIGVCIPVVGRMVTALSPERNFFFIMKAFAAGVVLSTRFIHVLPNAFDSLTSPCIGASPWGDFPFTGFIAMLSAIGTLMVDSYAVGIEN